MERRTLARTCLAIVLAAGEGTRMRSARPKVLHALAGKTLLAHVLDTAAKTGITATAVVIGPGQDAVAAEAKRISPDAAIFVQAERRGTAQAVLAAKPAIAEGPDEILILYGDTPLIRPQTLERLRAPLAEGAALAVLGFRPADPSGYGRLIVKDGELVAIREDADASTAERGIALCNGGLMALAGNRALAIIEQIGNRNRKAEFYLTDAVEIARGMKLRAVAVEVEEDEVRGINNKAQLAEAEAAAQRRLRQAALEAGVTLIAPETVFLSADTKFGRDVTVEPYVVFGEKVTVDDDAVIHSFSQLAGAHVGKGVSVGPFARLRPGTRLGEGARIGNFVEVKEALIEAGAKVNHLSYVGDAFVGANANVGAGTITCNYDGSDKHRTTIGKNAFIGSNSALVAPVEIGEGAYIGSGSVITENVPADALALARGRQTVKEGWASRLRGLKLLGKKKAPARD
ncbi:MAG TPA: bifunctional UDP-N-acetylglucosamine diphosphorylase/glucosamine-1-phosphate N-acetyltransferase GlmU [Xanthobacteraceae bacterium]|jgi:bifunctional UDP-N-acetylglucosamine pyrophosphorylase/glucosamine-1-phosphate N-acetyltransferase|nr:bifunctional UDP-N-acetylglucosamine diphosphorylase/glucosamine-1-phosphate N-acetyltransferase GlmU [Xanthobacteraceae bacterium]